MKKVITILTIISMIFCLAGCEEKSSNEPSNVNCGYKYTYTCGFNMMSGRTECNHGYYMVCN